MCLSKKGREMLAMSLNFDKWGNTFCAIFAACGDSEEEEEEEEEEEGNQIQHLFINKEKVKDVVVDENCD